MLTRKQKEALAKDLSNDIKASKSVVICDYKGMNVSEMGELRSSFREKDAKMQVAKKTLMSIALKDADVDLETKQMEGQLAIVFGQDEVSPSKILYEYAEKNDNLNILGGVLEGKAITESEIVNLAKLPSKEELLAKVVGSINAPISGFVNVLNGNLRNFVFALSAIKEAKSEVGE